MSQRYPGNSSRYPSNAERQHQHASRSAGNPPPTTSHHAAPFHSPAELPQRPVRTANRLSWGRRSPSISSSNGEPGPNGTWPLNSPGAAASQRHGPASGYTRLPGVPERSQAAWPLDPQDQPQGPTSPGTLTSPPGWTPRPRRASRSTTGGPPTRMAISRASSRISTSSRLSWASLGAAWPEPEPLIEEADERLPLEPTSGGAGAGGMSTSKTAQQRLSEMLWRTEDEDLRMALVQLSKYVDISKFHLKDGMIIPEGQEAASELASGDDLDKLEAEKKVEELAKPAPGPDMSAFPDGGMKAWLCVLGGFCGLFCSFGWINAIGVFQEYYQSNLLSQYSSSTISWIPSLETFFMFFGGPIVGKLFDSYGPRYLLLIGSFLHVFGIMMTSLATEYYQILLAQGICSPIGASMLFYPSMSSVVTWFLKKRALALGIMISGSSLGGVIFPIMVQNLIPEVGYPWTMRICGFMILGLLFIVNAFVTCRLPPNKTPFSVMQFVRPMGEPVFGLTVIAAFLVMLGLFVPFDFITLSAIDVAHMQPGLSEYVIPILNALSVFGRILPGAAADKLGRFNVQIAMCSLCFVFTFAIWLPARGNGPYITFAALYGFVSGAFVSLMPAIVAQISNVREIGVRTGAMFGAVSVAALVGNPIAGAILASENGSYLGVQIWTGCVIAGGCFFFGWAKYAGSGGQMLSLW